MRLAYATTAGLLGLLGLASTALASTVFDNCNDGDVDGRWRRDVDSIRVQERQGKLRFRSDDSRNGRRFSGYDSDRWDVDFTRNYTLSFRYRLDVDDVSGNRYAAVGACLNPSGPVDQMFMQVRQEDDGLCVVYEAWQDGQRIARKCAPIDAVQGQMTARYRAAADRLDVMIDDRIVMRVRHVLDHMPVGNGSSNVDIGAGRRGPINWSWNDVWMDNVRLSGQILDDDDYDDDYGEDEFDDDHDDDDDHDHDDDDDHDDDHDDDSSDD